VHGILFLLIELIIPLFHIDPAAFRFDICIDLGQLFARHGYHFHQQAGGIYAVLSMDMASYGKASGGFAADNGICFRHLGGNMFEAYRNLIAFFPEFFCHLIQHMRGADIADNRAVPAFIFHKVIVQQDHDIVGMKEFALIIDDSQPVRVPVRSDSDVAFAVQDEILQRTQGCRRRRGKFPAEQGVVALMDGVHLTSGCEKDSLDRGFAHAVHGIQGDLQPAAADSLHIDIVDDIVQVFIQRIDFLNQSGFQSPVVFHRLHFFIFNAADIFFDFIGLLRAGIPASCGEHLDTVINGRVMAGGNHHTIGHFMLHHIKHDKRRGR